MSQGKDLLVFFSATTIGTVVEVELQGDLTINTGKSVAQTVYKNGQEAGQNDSGFNISFTMANSAPMSAGEAIVWGLHDSGDVGHCTLKNAKTGGVEFDFDCRVAIPTLNSPSSGTHSVTVNAGAVGTVTRSAAKA